MKAVPRIFLSCLVCFPLLTSATPNPQKKKGSAKKKQPISATAPKQEAPAPPAPAVADTKPAPVAPAPEKNPQYERWRIAVEPYAILGSGHPGKAASDFDKPDGVAFTPNGWLLATDAKNRRVQIWDVKTKAHLGEFGHGVFGGEIVDIAVAPDGMVYVTDQTLNLAYAFVPPAPGAKDEKGKPLGPYDYQFKGTRFGEQGFDKLGGIAIDSQGQIFVVDAHLNEVRRFNADGTVDKTWKFEKAGPGGDTYLHGCEGIAIDESTGNLYIASEKDAVVQVFDAHTGAYKRKLIGAAMDAAGKPAGQRIFSGSVEGLAFAAKHLFAVDEAVGHVQVFDLGHPEVFNTDLSAQRQGGGYRGFFGHSPLVDFEDKTNRTLQAQIKDGSVIPGQANPPGYFCSPDSIAAYSDKSSGETYVVIADQCNYRLAVYRWSDLNRAAAPIAVAASSPAPSEGSEPTGKHGKKKAKKHQP